MLIVILLLSISLHEFGHAKFADMAGDPTPRNQGRVTLNPLAHLDPLGTIFIILTAISGVGLGWGKPVMSRPDKMRDPRWDPFVSVLAGPAMNLVIAAVAAGVLRLGYGALPNEVAYFLLLATFVNIGLMVFNLIPLGPLDGHWLVGYLLPEPTRHAWFQFHRSIGTVILLGLVILPPGRELLFSVTKPVQMWLMKLLLPVALR